MNTFDRQDSVISCRQFVVVLVDLVKQSGVHPDKILRGTRCFYEDLNQANKRISSDELLTIIDNALRYSSRDDLSFILGKKYFPSQLGSLEQVFLNCKNIGQMLKLCLIFQFQLCPFLFINIIKTDDKTHLLINSAIGKISASQQNFLYEFMLTALLSAVKYRMGETIPVTIKLPYKAVDYIEQYHVHLPGNLSFDQQLAMLSFDNKWLNTEIIDCSSSLKSLALTEAKSIRGKTLNICFVQAVCHFITNNLYKLGIGLEHCAQSFGISTATLKRKLAQHKTSYQLLLDQMRCQHAVVAMIEKKQNNEGIATSLQFNDTTNFRRAFKRWTGMTPTDFRERSASLLKS